MKTSFLHRPVTFARRGMVVAPHYLAAEAGLDLLKAGGNALSGRPVLPKGNPGEMSSTMGRKPAPSHLVVMQCADPVRS